MRLFTFNLGEHIDADMVILSDDYFSVSSEKVRKMESLMTIVNGKIVYAADDYKSYDPSTPAVIPDWSPVKYYGGYQK